jgi:hypothetical protein
MKKNSSLLFLIYFILSLFVFTYFIKTYLSNKKVIQSVSYEKISLEGNFENIKKFFFANYFFEGSSLNENSYFISSDSSIIKVLDIVKDSPKLFIYHNAISCEVCIDKLINDFTSSQKFIQKENIIVFGDFNQFRDVEILKQTYQMIFENIYTITDSSFDNPFSNINMPVMFVIDSSLRINCVYIADKSISYLNHQYLDIIYNRYFQ